MTADPTDVIATLRRPATQGNPVRDLHPLSLVLVLASLAVASVALPGPVPPAVGCAAFAVIGVLGGVGRSFLGLYLRLFLAVGLILFVLRALLTGETPLLRLGPVVLTREGTIDGLRFALVVMALSGALTLYFALVPPNRLMLALELKGVTPKATYVLLASFQSITDLGKNARVVLEAQKARGIETEGNPWQRLKAFVPVLAPVFLTAMASTEERAIALDARAFSAPNAHSHLVALPETPVWERVLVVVVVIAAVLVVVGSVVT